MADKPNPDDNTAVLIASQRAYYDARADDYGDESKPSDRNTRGLMPEDLGREIVDGLHLEGDVLEFACGTGFFTGHLARHPRSVTAVDASPRMLAINKSRISDPKITYVESDIFDWKSEATYDAVFFGFWLSHVPPALFDDFWALVRSCLAPSGRAAFIDEDDRAAGHERPRAANGSAVARRTLSDGREFDIVKVFWRPADLTARLRALGWVIDVHRAGETFMYGAGRPTPAA